jgi:hypothetical protein
MKRVIVQGLPEEVASTVEEDGCTRLPITPSSTVAEVLLRYPRCVHVLRRFGLNCCACVNAEVDTVEAIARALACPLPELLRELAVAADQQNANTAAIRSELPQEGA